MKNIYRLIGMVAAGTAILAPMTAFAAGNVTGTVSVTGSVTDKCFVAPSDASFSGVLAFGELSTNADSTLSPSMPSTSMSLEILCNTVSPKVTISATPLTASASNVANGYSDTVDFIARIGLEKAGGGTSTFSYVTLDGGEVANEPSTGNVGDRLKVQPNNVTITADTLTTRGGQSLALVSSNAYAGSISITVTPS